MLNATTHKLTISILIGFIISAFFALAFLQTANAEDSSDDTVGSSLSIEAKEQIKQRLEEARARINEMRAQNKADLDELSEQQKQQLQELRDKNKEQLEELKKQAEERIK